MNLASRVQVRGPLAGPVCTWVPRGAFRARLHRQFGIQPTASVALVSDWLAGQTLAAGEWTPQRVRQYVEMRLAHGRRMHLSERPCVCCWSICAALGGVGTGADSCQATTPAEVLLARHLDYLVCQQGLADTTVGWYQPVARRFLSDRQQAGGGLDLVRLAVADAHRFLAREYAHRSVGSAKNVASGVRSLLRFLHAEGSTALPLAQALPAGVGWGGRGAPEPSDFTASTWRSVA